MCVVISCEQNISKSYEQILAIFSGKVEHGPGRFQLVFRECWIIFQDSFNH